MDDRLPPLPSSAFALLPVEADDSSPEASHRTDMNWIGLPAICPDPACARARRCAGAYDGEGTPCSQVYAPELAFLLQGPFTPYHLFDLELGARVPPEPGTPGLLAWRDHLLAAARTYLSRRPPERARVPLLAVIYGAAQVKRLRRAAAPAGSARWTDDPDRFAAAMARGEWGCPAGETPRRGRAPGRRRRKEAGRRSVRRRNAT